MSRTTPRTRPAHTSGTLWLAGLTALLLAAAGGAAVWQAVRPTDGPPGGSPTPQGAAGAVSQDLTILISGDTAGWMVPCGCTSNQSGGLLRRATFVANQRRQGPVLLADAGGAPTGPAAYERLKFEAILRGELRMGIAVHNLGGPEAAVGPVELRRLEHELKVPFISANLQDSAGRTVAPACRILEAAGRRIAFIGVLSRQFLCDDVQITEPRAAVLATLAEQAGRFDAAVVLAYLPESELRELAASLPEVHAVVGGPTGQALAPVRVGPTLLAAATNKGKFVVRLKWAGEAGAGDWTGDVVEQTQAYADDLGQKELLAAFRDELGRRDLTAAESGLPPIDGSRFWADGRFAGSAACAACHGGEHEAWQHSGHAEAWNRLVKQGAHVDAACQQCHTTGFGRPGGFVSTNRSAERVAVGCESCHGPASLHVQDPTVKTPFSAREQCRHCHDRENSPRFEFDEYWPQIVHGGTKP